MKETTIIKALFDWFMDCEVLNPSAEVNVDYLSEEAQQYSLETVPCSPIINRYPNGSSKNQYLFIFASREYYSEDECNNLKNLAFYEELQEWITEQNIIGHLPKLPEGCDAQSILVLSSGYVMDNDTKTARYQIQCQLKYIKEVTYNAQN